MPDSAPVENRNTLSDKWTHRRKMVKVRALPEAAAVPFQARARPQIAAMHEEEADPE